MVGAIEQVERDITALKQAVGAIAQDIFSLYTSYLSVLGQALRQQLIRASYHLCTQVCAEAFLQLSWNQRQQFQQALQQLGQQAELQVQECLQRSILEPADLGDPVELSHRIEQLEQAIAEGLQAVSQAANQLLQSCGLLSAPALELVLEMAAKAEAAGGITSTGSPNLLTVLIETEDTDPPSRMATLDLRPEIALNPDLALDQSASSTREPVRPRQRRMRAGTTSSYREDSIAEGESGRPASEIPAGLGLPPAAIVAIYLRLGEIEFADSTVMAWRNQIRKLLAQLPGLQREFIKKQRERTIAEAEAAWRAAWFDYQAQS